MHRAIAVIVMLSVAVFFAAIIPRDEAAGARPSSELQQSPEACDTSRTADDADSGITATCNHPPAFFTHQAHLPACLLRDSRALASLRECVRLPSTATVALADATAEERMELVRARWVDGEWGDVIMGGTYMDLARAHVELEQGTELGHMLLRTTVRAVEMALEDAPKYAEYF